jgi:hypothetical protein
VKQFMLGILLLVVLSGCGFDWFPSNQPEITTQFLPLGVVGVNYSQTLSATGGTPPLVWGITEGSLPDGLSLSSSGVISGIPTKEGTSRFTVLAGDTTTKLTGTHTYTLVITTATSLTLGTVGKAYVLTTPILAPGGMVLPITWTVSSGTFPPGLTLSSNSDGSAAITGTPTTAGDFVFNLTATDSSSPALTSTNLYSIHINASGFTNTSSAH